MKPNILFQKNPSGILPYLLSQNADPPQYLSNLKPFFGTVWMRTPRFIDQRWTAAKTVKRKSRETPARTLALNDMSTLCSLKHVESVFANLRVDSSSGLDHIWGYWHCGSDFRWAWKSPDQQIQCRCAPERGWSISRISPAYAKEHMREGQSTFMFMAKLTCSVKRSSCTAILCDEHAKAVPLFSSGLMGLWSHPNHPRIWRHETWEVETRKRIRNF